jgi:uncharacterized membrane protein YgdD (TMEM256/DUF423 family)
MSNMLFVTLGGLFAAVAVGLGAIGAHALQTRLEPAQMAIFEKAVHYQLIHAIGLILVGLLCFHHRHWLFDAAGWSMLAGIVLFSGFLYVYLATGRRGFVHPVPVGGMAFITGWLLLAAGAFRAWWRY